MPHRAPGRLRRPTPLTLVDGQETERARIARELHDSVGQKLALLQIDLDQIACTLRSHAERTRVQALSRQVADIARELHDISYELHPLKLEILGLARSLAVLCQEHSRRSGIAIAFSCDADVPDRIGSNESLCLYRVAQEALHNVVTHSNAARASVRLGCFDGALGLIVADAGQGFNDALPSGGLGLTSMRQRVALLNGSLDIHTNKGDGTRISVRIPCRRNATAYDCCALGSPVVA